jgi:hypothetical protein
MKFLFIGMPFMLMFHQHDIKQMNSISDKSYPLDGYNMTSTPIWPYFPPPLLIINKSPKYWI